MVKDEAIRERFREAKRQAHKNTRKALWAGIDAHEVISFDIFDTLLGRKVLIPEDVFDIVSERALKEGMRLRNFREMRIKAQENLGLTDPDIYDIYTSFQQLTGVADVVRDRLIQLEFETELEVLTARRDMVDAYHYALQRKKKVYLVSDMYLPAVMMESILKQFDIISYEGLMISCDYKKLKIQGLFQELVVKADGASVLHIGDHEINDGVCAEECGIDTFLVCTPWELAERSAWDEFLGNKPSKINDRSLVGLSIATMFNSPFKLSEGNELPELEDEYRLGFTLIAPVVTVFMDWFLNQIKNKGYDGVLLAARDGFLIHRLYKKAVEILKWYDMPRGIYFQTSRKAAVTSDMANEAVINMLIGMRGILSPEEVLSQLFGLDPADIIPFPEGDDWDLEIYNYVWKHKDQIFQKSADMRRNYYKYMGNLELKIGGKYVFYDFVSSGTCQKTLNKIVPFDLHGRYFGWNSQENKRDFGVESLFERKGSFFIRYYKVLEMFMTSDKPSLAGLDKYGRAVLARELRTEEEIERALIVQKGISDYFEDYIRNLYIQDEEFDVEWADKILNCIIKTDISKLSCDLYELKLTDDWNLVNHTLREIVTS